MRAWAIFLALAAVAAADEDAFGKSTKVGSLVETIGYGSFQIQDRGSARFTFWEKTVPHDTKPKISCGMKTSVPGNYTLEIVKADKKSEILLVTVTADENDPKEFLRAYFPVNVENLRPSTIYVRLLRNAQDVEGEPLGSLEITKFEGVRSKREEEDDLVIRDVRGTKKKKRDKQDKDEEKGNGKKGKRKGDDDDDEPKKDKKGHKKGGENNHNYLKGEEHQQKKGDQHADDAHDTHTRGSKLKIKRK